MEDISVLMSLYEKEKPPYVRQCFDSLLRQTKPAAQWVVVEDGPLTPELYGILEEYEQKYPGLLLRVPLKENRGLGLALQEGLLHCSYEMVARMDTDDICREDRFEKQLEQFEQDKTLDICGSHIQEFEDTPDVVVSVRRVPVTHAEILEFQKRRDSFNHMTVMFKKTAVLQAGNYQSCMLMEDTYLWVRMLQNGAKTANVDDTLVFARIGKDMFERRGGYDYYKKYKMGRKQVYETGFISRWDYVYTLMVQFVVAMMPNKVRGWVFKNLLHH